MSPKSQRLRMRSLQVTVRESDEPVDVDGFCDAYARAILAEMQAAERAVPGGNPARLA